MNYKTIYFCLCLIMLNSCAENQSNSDDLAEAPLVAKIQKISEGQFFGGLGYVNKDSTEMHFFLWTGWRYSKTIDNFQDTIDKWIDLHPDAVVVPIVKFKEINKNGESNYLSLFIDKTKGDTLQIDMINKGYVYAGHCLPVVDSEFQKDSCLESNPHQKLLIPCKDFKTYINRVFKIHQYMDTTQFHYDWKSL